MRKVDHQVLRTNFLKADNALKNAGFNFIDELVKDTQFISKAIPKDETLHFPQDDVIDSETGYQYFLHRHSSEYAVDSLHIHFLSVGDRLS